MIKDQWIQKAKALLFDMQFDCENLQLNREAAKLIEEAGGFDPYTETSETELEWDMPFLISLEEVNNANAVGEFLRAWAFTSSFGCYSCFDLIDGFEDVKDNKLYRNEALSLFAPINSVYMDQNEWQIDTEDLEYQLEVQERMSCYYHKEKKVLVAWFWDGDGELYFNADGVRVYNNDCKKDYRWQFVEEIL